MFCLRKLQNSLALFVLLKYIKVNGQHINYIYSDAENPISSLLLIKYFNAETLFNDSELNDIFSNEIRQTYGGNKMLITYDFIHDFMEEYGIGEIPLIINLNNDNVQSAKDVFKSTSINCNQIERSWDERIIVKDNDGYDSESENEIDN